MELEDVLRTEIEQQYEQYRWIGRQQTLVFTFYGVIVAATFALIRAFSQGESSADVLPWFFTIILFLGVVGIFVSVALIHSRGMQFRTAVYLLELLIQMTELSDNNSSLIPAIKFRQLPTSGGRFMPRDTATVAISLAFVFGIALILAAILFFITNKTCISMNIAALLWLIALTLFSYLGIKYILSWLLEKENNKARKDWKCLRDVTTWADYLRRDLN